MALVRIPDERRTLRDAEEITGYLKSIGIDYERWRPSRLVASGAAADEILKAYAEDIERLKAGGGYVTADVIDVQPQTPGLEQMLAKFGREHWHDDDEVRFVIHGRGLFHIRPRSASVVAIEVEAGDLIRVPKQTWHWFDLCTDRTIRAIRLRTGCHGATDLSPVCMGAAYFPAASL